MTDLFDAVGNEPAEEGDPPEAENQVPAEAPAEENEDFVAGADGAGDQEGSERGSEEAGPAAPAPEKSEPPRQVNIVEEDPYEFDQCQITLALALLPDDGSPEGRPVALGARNHQDEPILASCRLGDLLPLPGPLQRLLEQLKADLPARAGRAAERSRKAEEAKRKAEEARMSSRKKSSAKPAAPAKAGAEKPKAASLNLFELLD